MVKAIFSNMASLLGHDVFLARPRREVESAPDDSAGQRSRQMRDGDALQVTRVSHREARPGPQALEADLEPQGQQAQARGSAHERVTPVPQQAQAFGHEQCRHKRRRSLIRGEVGSEQHDCHAGKQRTQPQRRE
jgi:hypothetical protein